MCHLGILAYGSLIDEPGKEIELIIRNRISGIETPFCIEFARSSSKRDGAPTVIPVENGGARVRAIIFVLKEDTPIETAQDLLWRRETRNEFTNKHYKRPIRPNPNSMVIEQLEHFEGVETVLYTKLGANIEDLTPETLADFAIKSAKSNAGKNSKDGISYLITLKKHGIVTPLMPAYEQAILKKTNTRSLEDALVMIRNKNV
jgi:cation transport regulator ChaC